MAMGLIAAALGGAGKALSSIGEMEAKKQNEAKLRKELMDMESVEKLRLDEITFDREMQRAPIRAKTTAEANVIGETAGLEAANKSGLPAKRAEAKVAEKVETYAAEDKAGLTKLEASRDANKKIQSRLAELEQSKIANLPALEAKAKYDGLVADIDAAEASGYDVKEARRKASIILADLNAKKEAGIPKAEAGYAADKRLEEIRAVTEKNLFKEEADLLAKQELAKIQAMTAQGVPEAEAKLLSAKWKAQKTQRDEAAAEKTQQEMNDLITKMKDPNYKKSLREKEAIDATGSLLLQANRSKEEKSERAKNTIEMERQIKETNNEIGRIIGIGDPKKIPDELAYLESQASKGDAKAIEKLKKVKPLTDELNSLSRELRSYKRGSPGADSSSGKPAYKIGETRKVESGPNKDKIVEWDGNGWVLKK